jgi:hypothetical protein
MIELLMGLLLAGCDPEPDPAADAPCEDHLRHDAHRCAGVIDGQGCRMVAWAMFQTCVYERSGVVITQPPAEAMPLRGTK